MESAIEAILQAVKDAGYKVGKDISLALDTAASEFYDKCFRNHYVFKKKPGRKETQRRGIGRLLRRAGGQIPDHQP